MTSVWKELQTSSASTSCVFHAYSPYAVAEHTIALCKSLSIVWLRRQSADLFIIREGLNYETYCNRSQRIAGSSGVCRRGWTHHQGGHEPKIRHWHAAHAATLCYVWRSEKSLITNKVTAWFSKMPYISNDYTLHPMSISVLGVKVLPLHAQARAGPLNGVYSSWWEIIKRVNTWVCMPVPECSCQAAS